jgi:cation diffusion facilitator family transporter
MHRHSFGPLGRWPHSHDFLGARHDENERRTWAVVALTAVMMVAEIVGGALLGSMALIADGWHMATHAGALAVAARAYRHARRHAEDERFGFGTGKVGDLAAYSSALVLAVIAVLIGYESALRLVSPVAISFDQAIAIATAGLAVNLASAWLLRERHDHHVHDYVRSGAPAHDAGDGRSHMHGHGHHHHRDHNLRAAYAHVLGDALTSVLAIVALLAGRLFGWVWMDAAMGLVGAAIIAYWAAGLLFASGAILLDTVPDQQLVSQLRRRLEQGGDRVVDLHLWRLGPGHLALVTSVLSHDPQPPEVYKARLAGCAGLSHVTVEVHACQDAPRLQPAAGPRRG